MNFFAFLVQRSIAQAHSATVVQRGGKVRPEPGRGGPCPAPSPIHTKKFGKVRPEVRGAGRGAGQEYKYSKLPFPRVEGTQISF